MKFLGIRNGHDCNVTYTDGTQVRYVKLERNLQIKHYNWAHRTTDDVPSLLEYAQRILGVDFRDLDGICFAIDTELHKIDRTLQINELFFELDKSKNPFWAQFSCPIYIIDHHYAHIFTVWPLTDITKVKHHFVFDGLGDHGRVSGIFETQNDGSHKLVEYVDRTENLGLSVTMEQIGTAYGMSGMRLDMSGKLMALKSYHNVPQDVTRQIMAFTEPLPYRHLDQFIQIVRTAQGQESMPDGQRVWLGHKEYNFGPSHVQEQLIDLAYLLHVFGEQKLPTYFAQFANPSEVITYSGGTAQNTVVNTKLRERFPHIQIPPHCPDDGLSLGCVEFLRQRFDQAPFDNSQFPFWQSDTAPDSSPSAETIERTAELLAQGKIVGWYQGHGEVGPRALGNRSILMDPSIAGGKDIINAKVKHREPYRPFGASILSEYTNEYFVCDYESPYMLYVIDCRRPDEFASIVHVDGSCRIQTVNEEPQYAAYRDLIESFRRKTGVPMLLNTSLNVDGKPIAGHPDDAQTVFEHSELDAVVIGNEIRIK